MWGGDWLKNQLVATTSNGKSVDFSSLKSWVYGQLMNQQIAGNCQL